MSDGIGSFKNDGNKCLSCNEYAINSGGTYCEKHEAIQHLIDAKLVTDIDAYNPLHHVPNEIPSRVAQTLLNTFGDRLSCREIADFCNNFFQNEGTKITVRTVYPNAPGAETAWTPQI